MSSELADAVFEAIEQVTEPLLARIKALEEELAVVKAAPPVPGPPGKDGVNGKDGRDGKDALDGKDGKDGVDGKDADPVTREQVLEAIRSDTVLMAEAVKSYLAANPIPPATNGKDGRDGVDGKDAPPVTRELVLEAIQGHDLIAPAVKSYLTENPPAPGKDGRDGKDGVGVTAAVQSLDGNLVVTTADGRMHDVGRVKGADGADGTPGKAGRDGIGHDDVDESIEDDGRVIVRKYLRDGVVVREFRHVTKQPVYRGVYQAGKDYQPGDEVTWGGALYQAKADTRAKPGEASEASRAWVLKVKRGADGKLGPQGLQGVKGEKGDKGERGPERWS